MITVKITVSVLLETDSKDFYEYAKTWLSGIIVKRGAMMKNLDFNFLRLHVIYSVCVYGHTTACLWKFRGQLLVAESLLLLCGSQGLNSGPQA